MTDKEQIRESLAYHLDMELSKLRDELTLNELGLDEVDIEELLLAFEDEYGTGGSLPALDQDCPLTPDHTVEELIAYIEQLP